MCNKKIEFPVEDNEQQNEAEYQEQLDEILEAKQMNWVIRNPIPNVPFQPRFLVRNERNILATIVTSFGFVVTFFPQYTYQMLMLVSSVLATLYHDEVIGFCHAIYILIRLMYRSLRGQE